MCHCYSFLSTSNLCCIFLSACFRPTHKFSLAARSFDQTMWSVSANTCAACSAALSADITVTQPRPSTCTNNHWINDKFQFFYQPFTSPWDRWKAQGELHTDNNWTFFTSSSAEALWAEICQSRRLLKESKSLWVQYLGRKLERLPCHVVSKYLQQILFVLSQSTRDGWTEFWQPRQQ